MFYPVLIALINSADEFARTSFSLSGNSSGSQLFRFATLPESFSYLNLICQTSVSCFFCLLLPADAVAEAGFQEVSKINFLTVSISAVPRCFLQVH